MFVMVLYAVSGLSSGLSSSVLLGPRAAFHSVGNLVSQDKSCNGPLQPVVTVHRLLVFYSVCSTKGLFWEQTCIQKIET